MPHAPARAGHATRARHPPGRARQSTAACAAPRPQCEDPEKETMALTLRPGYRAAGNRPKREMAGMGWETWKRRPHEWGRPRGHPAWKATLRFAFGRYQDQPNARRTTIVLPGCGRDHRPPGNAAHHGTGAARGADVRERADLRRGELSGSWSRRSAPGARASASLARLPAGDASP